MSIYHLFSIFQKYGRINKNIPIQILPKKAIFFPIYFRSKEVWYSCNSFSDKYQIKTHQSPVAKAAQATQKV